jgi:hypothetical protein
VLEKIGPGLAVQYALPILFHLSKISSPLPEDQNRTVALSLHWHYHIESQTMAQSLKEKRTRWAAIFNGLPTLIGGIV